MSWKKVLKIVRNLGEKSESYKVYERKRDRKGAQKSSDVDKSKHSEKIDEEIVNENPNKKGKKIDSSEKAVRNQLNQKLKLMVEGPISVLYTLTKAEEIPVIDGEKGVEISVKAVEIVREKGESIVKDEEIVKKREDVCKQSDGLGRNLRCHKTIKLT